MNQCHIIGGGDFHISLLRVEKNDFVIAADFGFHPLQKANITPDLYIGDGDSLGFQPQGVEAVFLPTVKDDTDMIAAVKEGLHRGYRRFCLYGALGGKRFSHSLANLQTLLFLSENGAEGEIIDQNCRISLLEEKSYRFSFSDGYFSLFTAESEAEISIKGALFPLSHAVLTPRFPLGVSNQGKGETEITVHRGKVFLILDK